MKIVIGAPNNGVVLKDAIKTYLQTDSRVSEVIDLSEDTKTYPTISLKAAQLIADGSAERGILICGTGIGTAIVASKVRGVRAATAHDLFSVRGAVENYNAQILCMGQAVIAPPAAIALIDQWLDARHDPASAYGQKVLEIDAYEAEHLS